MASTVYEEAPVAADQLAPPEEIVVMTLPDQFTDPIVPPLNEPQVSSQDELLVISGQFEVYLTVIQSPNLDRRPAVQIRRKIFPTGGFSRSGEVVGTFIIYGSSGEKERIMGQVLKTLERLSSNSIISESGFDKAAFNALKVEYKEAAQEVVASGLPPFQPDHIPAQAQIPDLSEILQSQGATS